MTDGRPEWWRWPLWSWWNMALTAVAASLLLAGAGRVSAMGDTPSTPALTPTAAAPATHSAPPPMPSSGSPAEAAEQAAPVRPDEVGLAFVQAWARPDADDAAWRTQCSVYATDRFAKVLSTATSGAVAASRAVGEGEIIERTESEATVRVSTDGGAVLIRLLPERGTWRVDGIEPEQSSALAGASRG